MITLSLHRIVDSLQKLFQTRLLLVCVTLAIRKRLHTCSMYTYVNQNQTFLAHALGVPTRKCHNV